jgi:hypothetical protein
MHLRPGLSFRVAPFFRNRVDWAERLRLNGGTTLGGGGHRARSDWRLPAAAELQLLVADDGVAADAALSPRQAALLLLPEHIRASWWTLAERVQRLDGCADGFDRFVADVLDFLRFKRLPLPRRCRCEVTAAQPGQHSTRVGADGAAAGLGVGPAPPASRLVCAVNLGDEATHLVLLNLLLPDLPATPNTVAPAEALANFFSVTPDYPLVRVRLDPGEGLWLPQAGVAYDGDTTGKEDPDMVLTVWSEEGARGGSE